MRKKLLLVVCACLILNISCKEDQNNSDFKNTTATETTKDTIPEVVEVKENKTEAIIDKLNKDKLDLIAKLGSSESDNQNKLYESYRAEREKTLEALNSAEGSLLEKYVNFYNEKAGKILLPDSIEKKKEAFEKANVEFWEVGEGYTELRNEPYFYATIFKNYLTNDYKDFLDIEAKENTVLYSADAGIAISFKEVSERMLSWEKFLIKFPNSKLFDAAKENYNFYVMDYLFGEDNTPAIEYADKTIYPENKTEFQRYIKENPNSTSTILVQFLLDNIEKVQTTDDLRKLLDKELSKYFIKK
jgi:hypothetical protein